MSVRNICAVCDKMIGAGEPQVQRVSDDRFEHFAECRPPTIEEHRVAAFERRTEERLMAIEKYLQTVNEDIRRLELKRWREER